MWKYNYTVPENKKIRLIVHTDCKNEADDQYALVHHLMTSRFEIEGIIAGHFCKNPGEYVQYGTAKASYDEILKVLNLMGINGMYPVLIGSDEAMRTESEPVDSEGARFIIRQAMKKDDRPLYIACQGAVTDIASALLMKPEIAKKIIVIWVGGAAYPKGGFEFNLKMDIHAVNALFKSRAEVWQIPMNVYKTFGVSLAELQLKVKPCGEIGDYLFNQLVEFNYLVEDRSFSFITKTPPAAVLLKKACNIKSGSGVPNKNKVATISKAKIQEIAEMKMPDLNAASLEAAMSMIAGTARSMGIKVEE